MVFNPRLLYRKLHRWFSILVTIPFLIVLLSGLLLQVKKQFEWIQPSTQKGTPWQLSLTFDEILDAAKSVPKAQLHSWKDIDRLDVRPDDGIIKIRGTNNWEIQIDAANGQVLKTAYRRSDTIESLHDGSWFHDKAKLWIFLPSAVLVTFLLLTGLYLFFYPYFAQYYNKKRLRERVRQQIE